MKKMLMLASVASMIDQFNMNNVRLLKDMRYEVHVAANFCQGNTSSPERLQIFRKELGKLGIKHHQIDFSRKIYNFKKNYDAYKQLKKLIASGEYRFIHCHSPIGGVCGRLVARKYKIPVIYTAHGFHFYKGAPILNWLLYYPIEKYLARHTDIILTINREDYINAKKFNLKKDGLVKSIPGVGLNISEYMLNHKTSCNLKEQLGISDEFFVILSIGELNSNKNHAIIMRAIAELGYKNIVYVLCGEGALKSELTDLSMKLKISQQVRILGYRTDIPELLSISNCLAFPSKREGLGMAAIEAMAAGLPLIVSDNRGTREYAEEGKTGFVCKYNDMKAFKVAIKQLVENPEMCKKMGDYNRKKAAMYDLNNISSQMKDIYVHADALYGAKIL